MNVSLRNFVFVLTLFTPILLFPNRSAADDCAGTCQDLWDSSSGCGECAPWPTHWCFIGCSCSYCYTGYGECHCYKDNKYYPYSDHSLGQEPGSCAGNDCGPRRIHVRKSAQGAATPASQPASIVLTEPAAGLEG